MFGWSEIPSQSFIQEVYAKAYSFREQVQLEIEGNQTETDRTVADGRNVDNAGKQGIFTGLSNKQ